MSGCSKPKQSGSAIFSSTGRTFRRCLTSVLRPGISGKSSNPTSRRNCFVPCAKRARPLAKRSSVRADYILATVPLSYPYHADPIDTYFRPSPAELAQLFRRSQPLLFEEVDGFTYAEDLKRRGVTVAGELVRTILWTLIFFVRPRSAAARLHRWRWFSKRRRVAIALLAVL